jgi:hypothetical protein
MPDRYDLKEMLKQIAEEKVEVKKKNSKMSQDDIKKMLAQKLKGGKK